MSIWRSIYTNKLHHYATKRDTNWNQQCSSIYNIQLLCVPTNDSGQQCSNMSTTKNSWGRYTNTCTYHTGMVFSALQCIKFGHKNDAWWVVFQIRSGLSMKSRQKNCWVGWLGSGHNIPSIVGSFSLLSIILCPYSTHSPHSGVCQTCQWIPR